MNRVLDANINRICEGLRVIEDVFRFEFNFDNYINELKTMRHFLRENFSSDDRLISDRDSINDKGKKYSKIESNRKNFNDILKANFLRVEEGLRVIEEVIKIDQTYFKFIKDIKTFRFNIYTIEKEFFLSEIIPKLKNFAICRIRESTEIQKLLNTFNSVNFDSIELRDENISKKNYFKYTQIISEFCVDKKKSLFVFNSADTALSIKNCGLIIDNDYISINDLKINFKQKIGFHTDKLSNSEKLHLYDFVVFKITDLNDIPRVTRKFSKNDDLSQLVIYSENNEILDKISNYNKAFEIKL